MAPTSLSFLTQQEFHRWQDVPGWLMLPAAEALYRYASEADPAGAVVEIGSYAGKSAICIARGLADKNPQINRMYAIDIGFRSGFRNNLAAFNVSDKVHSIEQPSLVAATKWTQPVSFLYIDGNHGKANAYADLLFWDTQVIPGGIVALDDTTGLMIGPNLQLLAALMTDAYELLSETCGVSFLRKKSNLLPGIGDYPLTLGSAMAHLHQVSAWLGAMDPAFRQPQFPKQISIRKRIRRKLSGKKLDDSLDRATAETQRLLEWLMKVPVLTGTGENTLTYLDACMDIRHSRPDDAVAKLQPLRSQDKSVELLHYRISVRVMSMLRLAQAYDLLGRRENALAQYDQLLLECQIAEIRQQAESGKSMPFVLDSPPSETIRDIREYTLDLSRYRQILPRDLPGT